MPVAKVEKDIVTYETVVKSLRRRKISCSVVAVPKKSFSESATECDTESSLTWPTSQRKIASGKRFYKKRSSLVAISKSENELSDSITSKKYLSAEKYEGVPKTKAFHRKSLQTIKRSEISSATDSCISTNAPKRRTYGKKSLLVAKNLSGLSLNTDNDIVTKLPQKRPYNHKKTAKINNLEPTLPSEVSLSESKTVHPLSFAAAEPPKKRAYRKKSLNVLTLEPKLPLVVSPSSSDVDNAFRFSSDETPKKRTYRKKIPLVPHNTPVVPLLDPETSCASASSISDFPVKRKRGRPRKNFTMTSRPRPLWEDESSSTTVTSSSAFSQESATLPWRQRPRRQFFGGLDPDEKDEEEEISEYELQRQKNIEENLKVLKQIFNERGLQFQEKSSETPKIRKSYTKLPLPPPRPKSARIEVRHSSCPLDFSKFKFKLSMD